jgi:pimeloyl-ACP methyl ester carboxylesterase
MVHTHQTAPTQFVEANGIRFAYRRFGNAAGIPLVFMQHFRGGMDHWDPTVTDGFAEHRPIILFDNAGVAASTGETPDTIDAMADHAADFVGAVGLAQIDLLGFSIGGYIAQTLALRRPELIRRLILAGTGPRAGEPPQDPKYGEYAALTDAESGKVPIEAFLSVLPAVRNEPGGREGLLGATAYAKGRRRPAHVGANNGGAAGGYHRVASTSRRTFCGTQGHQTADPCREWPQRHHGPDRQLLQAIPEHPKRPIDHLSRCGPWRAIPGT